MTPPRLPLTRAVRLLIAETTCYPCGLGGLPRLRDEAGELRPAPVPYTILDSLPGVFSGPPFADWHADAAWSYQVTSVGERDDQVQWLADEVRKAVASRTPDGWTHELVVPGMRVIDRQMEFDAGGDPAEVSPTGSIVTYVQRFTVTVTPA